MLGYSGFREFRVVDVKFGFGVVVFLLGYLGYFVCVIYSRVVGSFFEGIYFWVVSRFLELVCDLFSYS